MGRACDQLPPSEALPGIGEHSVVFHNGNGFYYVCKKYSSHLDERLFECMRPECRVIAKMGQGCGSPLVDTGSHTHAADLSYRDKCLLLHNLQQQFSQQEISISGVLQDALSSLEENEECFSGSNFECVTESPISVLVKEEPLDVSVVMDNDEWGKPLLVIQPSTNHPQPFSDDEAMDDNKFQPYSPNNTNYENNGHMASIHPSTIHWQPFTDVAKHHDRSPEDSEDFTKVQLSITQVQSLRGDEPKDGDRSQHFFQNITQHQVVHPVGKVKKRYSRQDLQKAINSVRSGMPFAEASRQFGIPNSTLKDNIRGRGSGRSKFLMPHEEDLIVERILSILDLGFPVATNQLLNIVGKLANDLNRPNPFPNSVPSKEWMSHFLKRHPEIAEKKVRTQVTEKQLRSWLGDRDD